MVGGQQNPIYGNNSRKGAGGLMMAVYVVIYDSWIVRHSETAASTQHVHIVNYTMSPPGRPILFYWL